MKMEIKNDNFDIIEFFENEDSLNIMKIIDDLLSLNFS
jgi:hypothetical protein